MAIRARYLRCVLYMTHTTLPSALLTCMNRRTHFYSATLPPQSSASTEDITLTVSTVQNHYSYPKPAAVTQDSLLQGMYWTGDLLSGSSALLVPSKLDASAVKVRVKSPTPRCNEEVVPDGWKAQHTTGSSIITFTLDGALELGLSKPSHAAVHYEQPEPVLTLLYLNRTLSISHWADSLSVSESMHLKNSGPELKGTFSRLTHQAIAYMRRQGQGTPHTLTSLNLALPKGVYNPYYIDEIGNVSTSRFRPSLPAQGRLSGFGGNSLLEITPRYPLMGGWNYTCEVGYKQPLGDVLKYDAKKGEYMLEVPFLTPVRGAAIDDVEVRIVLPDGARYVLVSRLESVTSSKLTIFPKQQPPSTSPLPTFFILVIPDLLLPRHLRPTHPHPLKVSMLREARRRRTDDLRHVQLWPRAAAQETGDGRGGATGVLCSGGDGEAGAMEDRSVKGRRLKKGYSHVLAAGNLPLLKRSRSRISRIDSAVTT